MASVRRSHEAPTRHDPNSPVQRALEKQVSPWKLGGLSLKELGKRVLKESSEDEITDRAAGLSYYFVFALFPALLFLTSLVGMLPIPNLMDRLMSYVEQTMPGDAASLIQKTLAEIVGGAHGGLVSIGVLAALWGASAGVASMMTALSVAYDVEDNRPWWKRRLIAIGLTVALAALLLCAVALLVFGGAIGKLLGNTVGLGEVAVKVWNVAQWPIAAFFVVSAIALVYYAAPAVEQRRWVWVTPGSVVATVAWIGMSLALRFYVTNFGNYTATYGSIAGVILLMLWLYLSGLVLLLGAEVNAEIEHAAAERGAVTAKARGEEAPGRPAPEPQPKSPEAARADLAAQARAEAARARAHARAPLTADDLGPVARHATEGVAQAASGTVVGVRALPSVLAYAGWRLVSGATGRLAGRRRPPSRSRRAA